MPRSKSIGTEVPGSTLILKDNALQLFRPMMMMSGDPAGFERLRCKCGCDELEVDRTTDGWCVECPTCGEASMLSSLINGRWAKEK